MIQGTRVHHPAHTGSAYGKIRSCLRSRSVAEESWGIVTRWPDPREACGSGKWAQPRLDTPEGRAPLSTASRTDWPLLASGTRSSRDQPFLEILPDGLASWTWPDLHFIGQGQTKLSVQSPHSTTISPNPHPHPHAYCELDKLRLNFSLTVLFWVRVSGVGLWEGGIGPVTDWLLFCLLLLKGSLI